MLRRLAIGLGLLVLVPLIGIPLWVATHRTDLPAVDDADLAIALPELAEGENGFTHIVRANELSSLSSDDDAKLRALLSGSERDDAWLRRALRDNRAALAELERAIAAPEIVFPDVMAAVHTDAINPLLHSLNLVRLANLESRTLRAKGERNAAIDRSLLGVRLGAAAMRARNPQLISAMMAIALQNISLREARLALAELPLDADASLLLSRMLERQRFAPEAWRRTWAGEYAFLKTTIHALSEQPNPGVGLGAVALLPASFTWQPNRTLASFGDHYRQIARAFAAPCARGRDAFAPADHGELLAEWARGNGLGATLLSIATPSFEKFNLRRCHNETRMALLEVELALRATGALPDPLPRDPFDGAPLRYDRARGLVYSIGWDFADAPVTGPSSPDDELEPAIYVSGARVAAP